MRNYKHLFFDLDRTLWDFDKNTIETFKEIYNKYQLGERGIDSLDSLMKVYKRNNDQLWEQYRNGSLKKEILRVKRFSLTLSCFGINNNGLAEKIGEDYIYLSPLKTNLFPHTKEVLSYLQKKYQLHIITNGFEEVQQVKVDKSDLKRYFKEIITSEEAGCKKPHKDIFLYALEKSGAKTNESLMIGDDLEIDILGAKSAGIDQIYCNYDKLGHNEKSTFEIQSLIELRNIL